MIRTAIKGKILTVKPVVIIGETDPKKQKQGEKTMAKQSIIIRQDPDQDEWSGRDYPSDDWEVDILGQSEIDRLGLDASHSGRQGEFFLQFNSKMLDKKDGSGVIYPINVRLGRFKFN